MKQAHTSESTRIFYVYIRILVRPQSAHVLAIGELEGHVAELAHSALHFSSSDNWGESRRWLPPTTPLDTALACKKHEKLKTAADNYHVRLPNNYCIKLSTINTL